MACSPTAPARDGGAGGGDSGGGPARNDEDGDGILDQFEDRATEVDTDMDGTPDYLDTDSDNDGIPDSEEEMNQPPLTGNDGDGDGVDDLFVTYSNGVVVVPGSASRVWTPMEALWVSSMSWGLAGDVDGDGRTDLVTGNAEEVYVHVGGTTPDLDADGALNLDDLGAFADAFLGGSAIADLNRDGVVNLDDIDAFAIGFLSGCP